jgi:hypothetical protein
MRIQPATAMRGTACPQAGTARGRCAASAARRRRSRRRWPAQRQVDGHQHHAQLVVGQHHAHRRHGPPAASACSISVWPGKSHAGGRQRFLVDRCGDDGRRGALPHPAHRGVDAGGRRRAGARIDLSPRAGRPGPAGRPGGCQHGRQPGGTWPASAGSSITATGSRRAAGHAPRLQHRGVAQHDAPDSRPCRWAPARSRDRCPRRRPSSPARACRHAGLSISMKRCSTPNWRAATQAATAGAP